MVARPSAGRVFRPPSARLLWSQAPRLDPGLEVHEVAVHRCRTPPASPNAVQEREGHFRVSETAEIEREATLVLGVLGWPMYVGVAAGRGLQKALLSRPSAEGRSNHSVSVSPASNVHQSASERTNARVQP